MSGFGWNDYTPPPNPTAASQRAASRPHPKPARPRRRSSFKTRTLLVVALVALVSAAGVFAYFTSHGSGSATASAGTVNPPTNVAATAGNGSPTLGPAPVSITWTAPTTGATPTGYHVVRDDGNATTALACSSSPCADVSVTNGTYTYHVTSLYGTSWTSSAADSNSIQVQNQAATATALISSDNPSVVDEQVTYAATVSSAGSGTPGGSITFKDGTSTISCESGSSSFDGTSATCNATYAAVTAAGSPHAITAVYSGDTAFLGSTSNEVDQVVNKGDQTIAFTSTAPTAAKVAGSSYTPTATGGASGNPVTFTIDASASSVCSIDGSNAVTFQTAGLCVIEADQAGDGNYNAAAQTQQSFTVHKGDQTISFGPLADRRLDEGAFTVSATASSGLTVSFSSATSGICTVSGTTVTPIHAGTCTVNADQAGDANWNQAPQVQRSFTINPGNQSINFTQPANVRFDQTPAGLAATATSGLSVTFTSTTTTVCTVSGSTVTLLHAGTCTINANQGGNSDWNAAPQIQESFTITPGNQTISFGPLANKRFDQGPITVNATASSGLTVSFSSATTGVCTTSGANGATVTFVSGANSTCTINANQSGNSDWSAAPQVQQSFTITPGNQTIGPWSITNKSFDAGTTTASATASSGLAVTFTSTTPSACTTGGTNGATITFVAGNNVTCTIKADQAGNPNWNAAASSFTNFTITPGNQTVNFTSTAPSGAYVGGPTYTPTATATSGLAVTFTIDFTTSGICSISSGVVSFNAAGTCKIDANQAGNSNWNAATQAQQPVTVTASNTVTRTAGGTYTLTVPAHVTSFTFTMKGAGGGGDDSAGGAGGSVSGTITIPDSGSVTTFKVIVGGGGKQAGTGGTGGTDCAAGGIGDAGGGGATCIYRSTTATLAIVVAGGGGGSGGNGGTPTGGAGGNGSGSNNGTAGSAGSGTGSGGGGGGGSTSSPFAGGGGGTAGAGATAGGSGGTSPSGNGGTGGNGSGHGASGGGGGGGYASGGGGGGSKNNPASGGGGGGSGYSGGDGTNTVSGVTTGPGGAGGPAGTTTASNGSDGSVIFTGVGLTLS